MNITDIINLDNIIYVLAYIAMSIITSIFQIGFWIDPQKRKSQPLSGDAIISAIIAGMLWPLTLSAMILMIMIIVVIELICRSFIKIKAGKFINSIIDSMHWVESLGRYACSLLMKLIDNGHL